MTRNEAAFQLRFATSLIAQTNGLGRQVWADLEEAAHLIAHGPDLSPVVHEVLHALQQIAPLRRQERLKLASIWISRVLLFDHQGAISGKRKAEFHRLLEAARDAISDQLIDLPQPPEMYDPKEQ